MHRIDEQAFTLISLRYEHISALCGQTPFPQKQNLQDNASRHHGNEYNDMHSFVETLSVSKLDNGLINNIKHGVYKDYFSKLYIFFNNVIELALKSNQQDLKQLIRS